jgi:colicin import membrane protein
MPVSRMATVQDARLQRPTGDRRSLAWSLALHGALLIIILLGGVVIPHKPVPSDLGIRATLIDPDAVRKMRRRPPPPEVRPAEPPPPDPAVQAERERQLSEQKAAERKVTEQKAVEKKLAAKKLAEQKAAERQAAEKQALEKRAADKAAAEKAAAQKAEAQRQAAEEKRRRTEQAELDRMLAEEDALLAAADSGALAEYVGLIRQKVERNWVRPPGAAAGLECELHVTQIPGGQVTGVRIGNCPADDAVRRSIEAAVLRASPLPMPANQALFERNLRFVFKPEE